jgi:hypothetical protein
MVFAPSYFALKEQNCWLMTCQMTSSHCIVRLPSKDVSSLADRKKLSNTEGTCAALRRGLPLPHLTTFAGVFFLVSFYQAS